MKKILLLLLSLFMLFGCRDKKKEVVNKSITLEYEPNAVKYYLYGEIAEDFTYTSDIPEKVTLEIPYLVQVFVEDNLVANYTVYFVDKTNPEVNVSDDVRVSAKYLSGVECTDNINSNNEISVSILGINLYKEGKYNGTIIATDTSGNKTKVKTIITVDHTIEDGISYKWIESHPDPIQ